MAQVSIKVLLVDDDPRLRSAWERLIQREPDMVLTGTLDRAETLVATVLEHKPDVVLLDLTMPGDDPLEAMAEAARQRPETRTVVYSGWSDAKTVQLAIDAGAWGFADKLEEPERVMEILRSVSQGNFVAPSRGHTG